MAQHASRERMGRLSEEGQKLNERGPERAMSRPPNGV